MIASMMGEETPPSFFGEKMKVSILYNPDDSKEVMNTLNIVAPMMIHCSRDQMMRAMRELMRDFGTGMVGSNMKDIKSFVDRKFPLKKVSHV